MVPKLHYFDTIGLGEAIRWVLHYGGIKFEDMRYTHEQWAKIKDSFPFGKVPVWEDEHGQINQSVAILKYLAPKAKLVIGDSFEDARLDGIVLTIYDIMPKFFPVFAEKDETKKAELKQQFIVDVKEMFLKTFDKVLAENGGYFAGKVTWADFVLVAFMDMFNKVLETQLEEDFPAIKKLVKNVKELPAIKTFLKNRKPYSL